jgi:putative hemolysin
MFGIILLIILLTLVNGFFAASEMALVSISPSQLYQLKLNHKKHVDVLEHVKKDSTKYLSTIQVAITFAGFLSSAFAGSSLSTKIGSWLSSFDIIISNQLLVVIITILLSFFTLIFGELVPKRIALAKSTSFALFSAPIIRVVMLAFTPFVWFLTISTQLVLKILHIKTNTSADKLTESDVKEMIVYGHIKGLYPSEETKMLERIFQLDDLTAAMIMTPLQDVVSLNLTDLSVKTINTIISSRFSRIPVFAKDNKTIKGFFLVKDILLALEDQKLEEIELLPHIRNPLIIDGKITINLLLSQMKQLSIHMAFVIDDKGQTIGIVTLEDIIEEIVGNIYDEHDDKLLKKTYQDYLTYIIDSNMTISEIETKVGFDLDSISQKDMTIKNYISKQLKIQKTPVKHTRINISEGYFDILRFNEEDIKQLRLVLYNNAKK